MSSVLWHNSEQNSVFNPQSLTKGGLHVEQENVVVVLFRERIGAGNGNKD